MRLLLYQHILLLVAVESQAEVGTSFLENLQEVCLHLRIERKLAILCLVETALGERRIYVQIFGIARWDGFAETAETSCPALTFGNEMVRTTLSLYLEKIGIQDHEGSFFSLCLLIIGVAGTGVATAAGCQRACNVVRNVLKCKIGRASCRERV